MYFMLNNFDRLIYFETTLILLKRGTHLVPLRALFTKDFTRHFKTVDIDDKLRIFFWFVSGFAF